ncbi:MAG: glycosyl hydrolase, partial [Micromonosporaceae bacterium]
WRWEMDRGDLADSAGPPEAYVTAWKRARRIFAEQGATNASWVWCPTAWGFGKDRAAEFYPGDDQVDWLCVDAYAGDDMRPLEDVIGPFMRWAKDHPNKPIMIGEYGAHGDDAARARWLREVGAMAKRRVRIKALVYFDSNFYDDGERKPYTLRNSPKSQAAYRELLKDPFFNPRRLPVRPPDGTQGRPR